MAIYPQKSRVGRFFIIFNIFKNLFIEPVENAVRLLYQGIQRFFLLFKWNIFAVNETFLQLIETFLQLIETFMQSYPQVLNETFLS